MKQLIVNADDFGLTKSINEGIVKAYKEGIVTSLNLLPTGEAFEDALNLAKGLKLEDIGAHLSLTETGPLTDPGLIPSLATRGGRFYKSHNEFFLKFFLGAIDRDEIYVELKNQLDALKGIGIKITNLSSHENIHMAPEILNIFVHLAKEYVIPLIRYPHGDRPIRKFEMDKIYKYLILSYYDKRIESILRNASLLHADHFIGFLDSGRLREDVLLDALESLKDGTTELVSHPGFLGPQVLDRYGFHINCEEELFALTSPRVKKLIREGGIKLITYQQFLLRIGGGGRI